VNYTQSSNYINYTLLTVCSVFFPCSGIFSQESENCRAQRLLVKCPGSSEGPQCTSPKILKLYECAKQSAIISNGSSPSGSLSESVKLLSWPTSCSSHVGGASSTWKNYSKVVLTIKYTHSASLTTYQFSAMFPLSVAPLPRRQN